jgi:hypothetical protein
MASAQQIEANTRNGRLAAGCKTDQGKAASARNATRHGLTSKMVVLADEDQAEFDELASRYEWQYSPSTPEQCFLVQQLAESEWRLRRARRLETAFFNQHTDEEILNDKSVADALARLTRYETAIERSYYKALKEVRSQMTSRKTEVKNALEAVLNAPLPISKRSEMLMASFGTTPDLTPAADQTRKQSKNSADPPNPVAWPVRGKV